MTRLSVIILTLLIIVGVLLIICLQPTNLGSITTTVTVTNPTRIVIERGWWISEYLYRLGFFAILATVVIAILYFWRRR